ncbi:MAG: hypothetical protein V1644_00070 [Candidatus Micrarchaeota archaeon]
MKDGSGFKILYANSQVDNRNLDLKQREATEKLAYLATQKGFYDVGEFQRICETSLRPYAENSGLKFAVVAKRYCNGIDLNANVYNEDDLITRDEPNPDYVCTNEKESVKQDYLTARLDSTQAPKNAVILIYPLAVPCPDYSSATNGLGTLNVIVWR